MSQSLLTLMLANLLFERASAQRNSTTTTTTTTARTTTTTPSEDDGGNSYMLPVAIAGIIVSVIVLLIILRNCTREEVKGLRETMDKKSELFFEAMSKDRWEAASREIEKYGSKLNFHMTDDRGNSIFHYAALYGRLESLDALLKAKKIKLTDTDPYNKDGDNVLRFVLKNLSTNRLTVGCIKSVRYILSNNKVEDRPSEGNAQLMFDIVKYVRDKALFDLIFAQNELGIDAEHAVSLEQGASAEGASAEGASAEQVTSTDQGKDEKPNLDHFVDFIGAINEFRLTPLHQALETDNREFLNFVMRHDDVVSNLANQDFVYSAENVSQSLLEMALDVDAIDQTYFKQLVDKFFSRSRDWLTKVPELAQTGSPARKQKIRYLNNRKDAETPPARPSRPRFGDAGRAPAPGQRAQRKLPSTPVANLRSPGPGSAA